MTARPTGTRTRSANGARATRSRAHARGSTPEEADELDAAVEEEISAALAFAQQSPEAGPDSLHVDHYGSRA